MRIFPRTARRRAIAAVAAAAVVVGAFSVPYAVAKDDLKGKQKQVEKKLDRANDDLRESSKQVRAATVRLRRAQAQLDAARSNLADVQGQLGVARAKDAEMQARLTAAEARVETAKQNVAIGRQKVGDQQDAVASMVSSIYTQGDPQLLGLASVLDAEDPADITRRLNAMDVMVGEETRAYDDLRAAEVLLVVQRNSVRKAKDLVAERRAQAAENLAVMEGLEQQARAATLEVRGLVSARGKARKGAARARQRDLREIKKLEREQRRIADLLRKRAAAAKKRAGGAAPSKPAPSGGFLNWPVKGYVTSSFGYRTHPIYGYRSLHDGTDFGTGGCGAPMHATADGKVISRYYQTAYGNRLILDHGYVRGVGLASIYNHATRYTVG
ncbi:murein hydrolase activator EnvC, partial [Nocardioides sp.]|uniref:murein hydrolase activator EnvC family protein n=1 Tax=Nocardioides sp. TaxID=35761 RepID=UPI00275CF46E|nr:hypothetical protein [Nocardioides sp.]